MSSFVLLSIAKSRRHKSIEETARNYSAFQSVEEMDAHLRSFVLNIGHTLSQTSLIVLEYLARHSLKAIGVSWLSARKLAELVGVTDRTIRRVLNQLEDLRIIKRIENLREDGGRAANLVAIQPVDEIDDVRGDVSEVVQEDVSHNQLNLLNQNRDDDNIYNDHYRYREFFKISQEWGIHHSVADKIFPLIKNQLLTTSWVALEIAFAKLRKNARNIGSFPQWFTKTLENENLLVKIGA